MMGIINGIMTVLGLITFLGIVWWAWSSGRAKDNQEAAALPFSVPDELSADYRQEESHE